MRVDFYQLSQGPVPAALARVARAVRGAGERLLVVSDDPAQLDTLDASLWSDAPEEFLAHGKAGEAHAARQPLLLASDCAAENGARHIAFADGRWRDEGFAFERAFLLFDAATIDQARACWRMLGERDDVERRFWKQETGRWIEGP